LVSSAAPPGPALAITGTVALAITGTVALD